MINNKLEELFKSFINDIIKVFPEYETRLNKYYGSILVKDDVEGENTDEKEKLITEFMDNIKDIVSDISKNNLEIFEGKDPIILNNVSFKVIWSSDISNESKVSIWKYLQSFCLHSINSMQGVDDISDVIKSIEQKEKVTDRKTLENIKYFKNISESMKNDTIKNKLSTVKPSENNNNEEALGQFEDILENSSIGSIAKQVTEELNIEGMINEGGGGIESILSGDNMMNIFKSISGKIESGNGGCKNNDLMKEAIDITNNMKDNQIFSSLMKNMGGNMSEMLSSSQTDNRNINLNQNIPAMNDTQKRLQKKLKEKKDKEKINVSK